MNHHIGQFQTVKATASDEDAVSFWLDAHCSLLCEMTDHDLIALGREHFAHENESLLWLNDAEGTLEDWQRADVISFLETTYEHQCQGAGAVSGEDARAWLNDQFKAMVEHDIPHTTVIWLSPNQNIHVRSVGGRSPHFEVWEDGELVESRPATRRWKAEQRDLIAQARGRNNTYCQNS